MLQTIYLVSDHDFRSFLALNEECPKFYKKDITSILKERNALKEKVIELEEEIVALKR